MKNFRSVGYLYVALATLGFGSCDLAYQIGNTSDAAPQGDPSQGGTAGGTVGGTTGAAPTDNTRDLPFACDLWGTGNPVSDPSGIWHAFSHALVLLWGESFMNPELMFPVFERYQPVLKTSGDLECVVRDLLQDARARGTLGRFYKDWLAFEPAVQPQAYTAVEWNEMVQNVLTFAIDTTAAGTNNLNRLFTSPRPLTFISGTERSINPTSLNAGLLSDPAVLTQANIKSFPTSRGIWFRRVFLCQELPPPPPPESHQVSPFSSQRSVRDQLESMTNVPGGTSCAPCHNLIDPPGFALAPLDLFGRIRDRDEVGFPFDTKGNVGGFGSLEDGLPFNNLSELGAQLAGTLEAATCYASHWNTFFDLKLETKAVERAGALLLSNRGDMRAAIAHIVVQKLQ